jgi:hypothetical protein
MSRVQQPRTVHELVPAKRAIAQDGRHRLGLQPAAALPAGNQCPAVMSSGCAARCQLRGLLCARSIQRRTFGDAVHLLFGAVLPSGKCFGDLGRLGARGFQQHRAGERAHHGRAQPRRRSLRGEQSLSIERRGVEDEALHPDELSREALALHMGMEPEILAMFRGDRHDRCRTLRVSRHDQHGARLQAARDDAGGDGRRH